MEFETVPRFFVLQWIEKYLFQWGFSDAAADLITFLVACGLAGLEVRHPDCGVRRDGDSVVVLNPQGLRDILK